MKGVVDELTKFYRMVRFQSEEYFVEPKEDGNKVERLFHFYLDAGLEESEIEDHLYFGQKSTKAFMMLRKDLVNRLCRYVLVVDANKLAQSRRLQQFVVVTRNSFIARVLLYLGLYKSGVHVAKRTIKDAMDSEIWDVVFTLSSILNNYYVIRDDFRSHKQNDDLADLSLRRLANERKIRKLMDKWTLLFRKKRRASQAEILELQGDIKAGDEIVADSPTPNLRHLNYRLKLFYYDAIRDYEKAIEVCIEARRKLEENVRYADNAKLGIYHGTQMYCYLNLKKFSEASSFAERFDEYFPIGTLNWFTIREYYFVLCIQTSRFDKAYEQLEQVLKARAYGQLRGVRKQMWSLFEGYMQFVIKSGLWKDRPNQLDVRQFRVAKFLNEVVSLSGDKAGIHVSVLILQIMFLLQQGRYEDIIDRKDALRRYVYRYLYSKENERSRIFLNMLLRMIECDFSYSITKTKTQRLYRSLTEQHMNYQANLGGNEIVDYEVLWDWALNTIKGSLTWKANAAS